jgi:hypothetical protein
MLNLENYDNDPVGAFAKDALRIVTMVLILWVVGFVVAFVLGFIEGGIEKAFVYALSYIVFMSK